MVFHCETPCIVCPPGIGGGIGPVDPSNPFLNLSSEAPDVDNFIGRYNTPGLPPLGQFFFAVGCVSFCLSDESQEEANLCAARQNVLCSAVNWPITVLNPDFPTEGQPPTLHRNRTVYSNVAQTCTFTCADGTFNVVTVPAGTIFSTDNQATADAQAHSLACNRAATDSICMGNLSADRVCYGKSSSVTVVANSRNALSFDVVGGALPDGMTLTQDIDSFTITGTPTTGGDFTFTIRATDTEGNQATRSYTLEVFGITNSSPLSAATQNVPYVLQLNLDGTTQGLLSYTVTSGALPTGLTLNSTSGIISGTPTVVQTATFEVEASDTVISCKRNLSLKVNAPALNCLGNASSIGTAVWTQSPFNAQPPCMVFTITAGVGTFTLTRNLTTCLDAGGSILATLCNSSGAAYNITVTIPWDDSGNVAPGPASITASLFINGISVSSDAKNLVTGPFTPFVLTGSIPQGAANTLEIQITTNTVPSPSVSAFSLGNLTITPLTPP